MQAVKLSLSGKGSSILLRTFSASTCLCQTIATHYDVLGIPSTSNEKEIRAAWIKKCQKVYIQLTIFCINFQSLKCFGGLYSCRFQCITSKEIQDLCFLKLFCKIQQGFHQLIGNKNCITIIFYSIIQITFQQIQNLQKNTSKNLTKFSYRSMKPMRFQVTRKKEFFITKNWLPKK